ncbi:uncharacterized protein EV420DRAFT_1488491 [Desarmillaria tabescens]|uniref:Uncharacterized protein n=1 Tax=Armillaria tabescens TaxID=1929756 RepID=A0AA39J4M8_ARMTA|nr:uncharacterized protein EV420DRAFT_1488491 [Desarmillaria tabescens]KAK0434754.1 hypothetical protein EV420DRAFT_1488491 [Desarmillaria tabescens]
MVHTIPWCTVLSPPNVSSVSPGVYENQLVWIPNGTTSAKWPVVVYCKRKDQALALNTHLNPFLVYHGQEDDVTFRASLHEWQKWPRITAMFDNDGATFWAIIYGARAGIFYHREHAVDQVDQSNPTYRRAHGFDKIENVLICQMSRSATVYGCIDQYPANTTTSPFHAGSRVPRPTPTIASPTASPVGTPSKQKGKAHIPNSSPRKTHHGNYLTSNVTVNSIGNGDIFSFPTSHSSPRTPVSLGQAGPSRPRSVSPLRLPKLLARYLEVYQYPKRYVSRHLEEADTRDDFIEAVEESIPEEAAGFIWDLFFMEGRGDFGDDAELRISITDFSLVLASFDMKDWRKRYIYFTTTIIARGYWQKKCTMRQQKHCMTSIGTMASAFWSLGRKSKPSNDPDCDDFGDGHATCTTLVQKSNKHSLVESKVSRPQKLGPVEVPM